MAQATSPITGQKRGPGRPAKSTLPADKKRKISIDIQTPLSSPAVQSPAPSPRSTKLPTRVSDSRALPTLSEPQPPSLSSSEYQSIAASAVLHSSLDRSRLKWIHDGVFERYWVKPPAGTSSKNATKLQPPNNPELKWQKHKGPCRIRVEPHIFEAEVYVEERPVAKAPPNPTKHFVSPMNVNYWQTYRPPQPQPSPYQAGRTLPAPIQQPANTLPPINQQALPAQAASSVPQEKKPDPVISMLATRASSDPELKLLMKEVAKGNASEEKLKVFQKHIDELTKWVADKKQKEEEEEAAAGVKAQAPQQSDSIQYDGTATNNTQPYQQQQQQYQAPYQPQQQQAWAPPPPPPPAPSAVPTQQPVIVQFTTPGSTEDRFLFPQNAILESLSAQHLLVSFITTTPANAASPEYWQPITMMVEVAYQREHILENIKKWVKPADEVRKYMENVMGRGERAPDVYLPLRLPVKGSVMAAEESAVESRAGSGAGTPVGFGLTLEKERKGKPGPKVGTKYNKRKSKNAVEQDKEMGGDKQQEDSKPALAGTNGMAATSAQPSGIEPNVNAATATEVIGTAQATQGTQEDQETTETGRPKRAVRKSVRISEV